MSKKILALVLSLLMVVSVVPFSIFMFAAAEEPITEAPSSYKGVPYDSAEWEEVTGDYSKYNAYQSKDGRLMNLYKKIESLKEGDSLTVAYLGGSITFGSTASDVDETSWRCLVGDKLTEIVAAAHSDKTVVNRELASIQTKDYVADVAGQITVNNINAAFGATSSWYGVYRMDEDLGTDGVNAATNAPDVAFVEFAYNDINAGDNGKGRWYTDKDGNAAIASAADYESIILRLYEMNPNVEIIGVLTTGTGYWDYIDYNRYPTLSAQRAVLRHYDIPYLYVGKNLVEKIKSESGIVESTSLKAESGNAWMNYFADMVHPNDKGHKFYADEIGGYIAKCLSAAKTSSASAVTRDYADMVASGTFFDTSILKLDAQSDRLGELYKDYLADDSYITGWRDFVWSEYPETVRTEMSKARQRSEIDHSLVTAKEGSTFAFRFTGTSVGFWYSNFTENPGKINAVVYTVNPNNSLTEYLTSSASCYREGTTVAPRSWRIMENAPKATYEVHITTSADIGLGVILRRLFVNGTDLTVVKHGKEMPQNLIGNGEFNQPIIADYSAGYNTEGNFTSISAASVANTNDAAAKNEPGYAWFRDDSYFSLYGEPLVRIKGGSEGMKQPVNIENGKTYKLTFDWIRNIETPETSIEVYFEYKATNGVWTATNKMVFWTGRGRQLEHTEYITIKDIPAVSNRDATNNKIYIRFKTVGSASHAYLDNISLTECTLKDLTLPKMEDEVEVPNMLEDEDFDSFTVPNNNGTWTKNGEGLWWFQNNNNVSVTEWGGSKALVMPGDFSWIRMIVPVEQGKTYRVSWRWRDNRENVRDGYSVGYKYANFNTDTGTWGGWVNAADSWNFKNYTDKANNTTWDNYYYEFTATTTGTVVLGISGDDATNGVGTTGQTCFDDIKVGEWVKKEAAVLENEDFDSFTVPNKNGTWTKNGEGLWWFQNNNGVSVTEWGGSKALVMPGDFSWIRMIVPVEQGKTYRVSWRWRDNRENVRDGYSVGYRYANFNTDTGTWGSWVNAADSWNFKNYSDKANNTTWDNYTYEFTATATGTVVLGISGDDATNGVGTTGQTCFDDIKVAEITEDFATKKETVQVGDPSSIVTEVKNGNLETGDFAGWDRYSRVWITDRAKSEGNYAAYIDKYTGGLRQPVALVKDNAYALKFSWDSNSTEERSLNVKIGDVLDEVVKSTGKGFEEYSLIFTATETEVATLSFNTVKLMGGSYLDNVRIEKVAALVGDSYIDNGDFETAITETSKDTLVSSGKDGWALLGAAQSTENAVSPTHSLNVGEGDSAFGVFTVDSGVVARFKLNYFGAQGTKATVKLTSDAAGTKVIHTETLTGNGTAQSIEKDIDLGTVSKVYITVDGVSGESFIDDMALIHLNRITLNKTGEGEASVDRIGALSGESVTLTVNSGTLRVDYPNYKANKTVTPLTESAEKGKYVFIMPDSDTTVNVAFGKAIGTELLPDVGFESGKYAASAAEGWLNVRENESEFVDNGAYAGKYAMAVKAGAYLALEHEGIELEKGSTYLLSLYHLGSVDKVDNINPTGIYLRYWENGVGYDALKILTSDDEEWNRYAVVFTADRDYTLTARVVNSGASWGLSDSLFDNISLKKVDPANPDPDAWLGNYDPSLESAPQLGELLKDESFESEELTEKPEDGWAPVKLDSDTYVSWARGEWFVTDGDVSIRLGSRANQAVQQAITVKPGTAYSLTFDAVVDEEGAGITIGKYQTDASGSLLDALNLPANHEKTTYTYNFNSGSYSKIWLNLWNTAVDEAAYFDNFSLTELDDRIEGDFGFRRTAAIKATPGETTTTITWSAVRSKLYHNDKLTYEVYSSDSKITEENIGALTAAAAIAGDKYRTYTFTGQKDGATYYYAVVARDPSGNVDMITSGAVNNEVTPGYELINPDFETGDYVGWKRWQTQHLVRPMKTAYSGRWSLEIQNWQTALYQPLLVKPNTQYVWSYAAIDPTGKLNFNVFSSTSMGNDAPTYVRQYCNVSSSWETYSGTFTTSDTQERVIIAFRAGECELFTQIDNVYFKEVKNPDLYFTAEPYEYLTGTEFIMVGWQGVASKDSAENITYTVYASEKPITEENISSLKAFATVKGGAATMATLTGVEAEKDYYIAVVATDTLGNTVTEYATSPFHARAAMEEEEELVEDEIIDEELDDQEEELDDDEPQKAPVINLGTFDGDDSSDDDAEVEEDENPEDEEPATKTTTKTIRKSIRSMSMWKLIVAIVCFVLAAAAVVFIVLFARRVKKLDWIAIGAIVLAVALIAVGIWLALTCTTITPKTEKVTSVELVETDDKEDASSEDASSDDTSSDEKVDTIVGNNSEVSDTEKEETTSSENNSSEEDTSSDGADEETEEPVGEQNEWGITGASINSYDGTVYYLSSTTGNDKNDGLTPQTAWKTLKKINETTIESGSKVLFRCGDTWRGDYVQTQEGVYYGNYGKGEKPTLYGSPYNFANASLWVATEYPNVWKFKNKLDFNVGSFSLNDDKKMSVLKPRIDAEELTTDDHFVSDPETYELYYYCSKGNPGDVYDSMEANTSHRMFIGAKNTVIDGFNIKYCNYGVTYWNDNAQNVTIRDLTISYVGGVWSVANKARAGNGIEIYGECDNVIIEDNEIFQCYDTAITAQFGSSRDSDIVFRDLLVRNNNLYENWWTTEWWIKAEGIGQGIMDNLVITNNIMRDAGVNWGSQANGQRSAANATAKPFHLHCMPFDNYAILDIQITNNIFDTSGDGLFYFGWGEYVPYLENNKYIQKEGGVLGYFYAKPFNFDSGASFLMGLFDKKPQIEYAK